MDWGKGGGGRRNLDGEKPTKAKRERISCRSSTVAVGHSRPDCLLEGLGGPTRKKITKWVLLDGARERGRVEGMDGWMIVLDSAQHPSISPSSPRLSPKRTD